MRKKVKKIELIESDFDNINESLNTIKGSRQYIKVRDCPIFRASQRIWDDVDGIDPDTIDFIDGTEILIHGWINDVEACRLKILKGKKGYIKVR